MKITGSESITAVRREMGNRIKQIRISRNMTQKKCAVLSGISVHTLSNLENGEDVSLANFCLVLRTLGCLSNLELLLPDNAQQPLTIVDYPKPRQRAGKPRKGQDDTSKWKWGDAT